MRSIESWPQVIIGGAALTMFFVALFAWSWLLEGILQ